MGGDWAAPCQIRFIPSTDCGVHRAGFVDGWNRRQGLLLPECANDDINENNPVRAVDRFIDELDLGALSFGRSTPAATGRPGYDPATLLKLYLYGYLTRIPSSRRPEREAQRNLAVIWLSGRLAPDIKTIADVRRDTGRAIEATCRQPADSSSPFAAN
jgi:transposase